MSIVCIETSDILKTTCTMQEQQAQFLYMLSTEDPQVFKLYFQTQNLT